MDPSAAEVVRYLVVPLVRTLPFRRYTAGRSLLQQQQQAAAAAATATPPPAVLPAGGGAWPPHVPGLRSRAH